jgi:hypothetical protein
MSWVDGTKTVIGTDLGLTPESLAEFDLFDFIDHELTAQFGSNGGSKFVQRLYSDLIIQILAQVLRVGTFRLPAGLGSFRLVRRRASFYVNAQGEKVRRSPSARLVYIEGDSVLLALGRRPVKATRRPPKLARLVNQFHKEQVRAIQKVTTVEIRKYLKERR